MHRGSSKVAGAHPPPAEDLPLSASTLPAPMLAIEIDVARAGRHTVLSVTVPAGTLVRTVIRHAHQAPEGCVVLIDGLPVPLDTPLERALRLVVLPTFSGG